MEYQIVVGVLEVFIVDVFDCLFNDEFGKIKLMLGDNCYVEGCYLEVIEVFVVIVIGDMFVDFLILLVYDVLCDVN